MLTLFGPISVIYPVVLTSAAAFIFVALCWWRGIVLQVFPSAAWQVFMAMPFLMNSGGIKPEVAILQAFGISMVTLALAIGDKIGAQRAALAHGPDTESTVADILWRLGAIVAAIAIVILPIYHLMQAGTIPLLSNFWQRASLEAAQDRENFSKLLDIPQIFKYAFNWVSLVFGPLLVIYIFPKSKTSWLWCIALGAVIIWIATYALLSTARAPWVLFIIFSSTATVVYWGANWQRLSRWLVMSFLTVTLTIGVIRSVELVHYQNNEGIKDPNYRTVIESIPSKNPLMGFTLGDVARLMGDSRILTLPFMNTITYRAFLVPSEVSSHWYAFFPNVAGNWREISELIGKPVSKTPAASNRVGRWAYYQRFTKFYGPTVSAYSSMDADAYSFGGLIYTFIAAAILFFIRLLAAVKTGTKRTQAVSALIIVQIGLLISSASLQAILFAQGMLILITVLIISHVVSLSSIPDTKKSI